MAKDVLWWLGKFSVRWSEVFGLDNQICGNSSVSHTHFDGTNDSNDVWGTYGLFRGSLWESPGLNALSTVDTPFLFRKQILTIGFPFGSVMETISFRLFL